jgi:hypothetical protein
MKLSNHAKASSPAIHSIELVVERKWHLMNLGTNLGTASAVCTSLSRNYAQKVSANTMRATERQYLRKEAANNRSFNNCHPMNDVSTKNLEVFGQSQEFNRTKNPYSTTFAASPQNQAYCYFIKKSKVNAPLTELKASKFDDQCFPA